jgi:hypothetical protein
VTSGWIMRDDRARWQRQAAAEATAAAFDGGQDGR